MTNKAPAHDDQQRQHEADGQTLDRRGELSGIRRAMISQREERQLPKSGRRKKHQPAAKAPEESTRPLMVAPLLQPCGPRGGHGSFSGHHDGGLGGR